MAPGVQRMKGARSDVSSQVAKPTSLARPNVEIPPNQGSLDLEGVTVKLTVIPNVAKQLRRMKRVLHRLSWSWSHLTGPYPIQIVQTGTCTSRFAIQHFLGSIKRAALTFAVYIESGAASGLQINQKCIPSDSHRLNQT